MTLSSAVHGATPTSASPGRSGVGTLERWSWELRREGGRLGECGWFVESLTHVAVIVNLLGKPCDHGFGAGFTFSGDQ